MKYRGRSPRSIPQSDPARFKLLGDEAPVHQVRITWPFYLGRHEVTVGQFARHLQASGNVPESISDGTDGYGYTLLPLHPGGHAAAVCSAWSDGEAIVPRIPNLQKYPL